MIVRRFREMKPHRKVGVVTFVLILSGFAVLVVSLTSVVRIAQPVDAARDRVIPAREHLRAVQQGLAQTQTEFITLVTEQDRLKRVLEIESVRKALNVNESSWTDFKQRSLELPGEAELRARYETLAAEFAKLEGPIGVLLINADDPSQILSDPSFLRIRDIQAESLSILDHIDRDLYAPLEAQQIELAASQADSGRRWIVLVFAAVMALSIPLAMIAYGSARRTEQKRRMEQERRAEEARRSQFEAQLNRAFEMAGSEEAAYKIVGQALAKNLADHPAELLIADSSVAHFRQVLSTDVDGHGPGCSVVAPSDCPASHRGNTMIFANSKDLDSCPYLRDRPGVGCAAICQPVSIAGKSIGVIHTTMADGLPATDSASVDLDLIARRAGERIGMLRAFAETETQARTDPLTGLLNRRSLENSTRRLVHDGGQYCVAYGDLDLFKKLNDTFGHDVGDRALRSFAKALRDSIRPNDLACRYGGEEFVLVLPDCDIEEAVTVVERVRSGLATELMGGRLPPFTVSFGVANSGQADSFEQVVALADEALLRAKANGRDRVLVSGRGPAELAAGPPAAPLTEPPGQIGPGSF